MQRIFPLPQKTAFLRSGDLKILPSISELGVYGTFLGYGANSVVQKDTKNVAESAEMFPVFHSGQVESTSHHHQKQQLEKRYGREYISYVFCLWCLLFVAFAQNYDNPFYINCSL